MRKRKSPEYIQARKEKAMLTGRLVEEHTPQIMDGSMSIRIVELINSVKPDSFLELGTWNGENFRRIQCKDKVSVDINENGTFRGTTDEFFRCNHRRFEATFIDACHDLDFVRRDWNNAISVTTKFVVMHDMVPPTKRHIKKTECSDSYLLLNHFIDNGIEFRALDHDCGLTVIRKEHFRHVEKVEWIDYYEFMRKAEVCTMDELIKYAS